MRKGYVLSLILFNIILVVLVSIGSQEKEIIGIKIGKEEVNFSLFAYDIILCQEIPRKLSKTLFKTIGKHSKEVGMKQTPKY